MNISYNNNFILYENEDNIFNYENNNNNKDKIFNKIFNNIQKFIIKNIK